MGRAPQEARHQTHMRRRSSTKACTTYRTCGSASGSGATAAAGGERSSRAAAWAKGRRCGFGTFTWPNSRVEELFYEDGTLQLNASLSLGPLAATDRPGSVCVGASQSGGGEVSAPAVDALGPQCDALRREKDALPAELRKAQEDCSKMREAAAQTEQKAQRLQWEKDALAKTLDAER